MSANVGDKLVCKNCGHKHPVTKSWLNGLSRRYYPTLSSQLQLLDDDLFNRLVCEKCRSKDIAVEKGSEFGEQKVCWSCAGDGGLRGNCHVCHGRGYL